MRARAARSRTRCTADPTARRPDPRRRADPPPQPQPVWGEGQVAAQRSRRGSTEADVPARPIHVISKKPEPVSIPEYAAAENTAHGIGVLINYIP